MTCQHTDTRQVGPARPYTGGVSRDENRAAHGGIRITLECLACGAQGEANINGGHEELGAFGPPHAERERAARDAERGAREALASVGTLTLTRSDGKQCMLRVDDDGQIIVPAGHEWTDLAAAVTPTEWFARARRARELVMYWRGL